MRPRAFSYQTYIKPLKDAESLEQNPSIVYWKPIRTNPITSMQLAPTTQGSEITWEISVNNKDWHQVKHPEWEYNFNNASNHEHNQNQLYIRAKLNPTQNSQPIINGLKAIITTQPADTAYLKTLFYNPRLGNLLGASLWSRLGTDIAITPPDTDIEVKVDVIRNMIMKDEFTCNGHHMTFNLTEKPSKPLVKVTIYPNTLYLTENQPPTDTIPPKDPTPNITPEDTQKLQKLQTILENIDHSYETIKNSEDTDDYTPLMRELATHFTNVNGIIEELKINNPTLQLLKESVKPLQTLENCNTSQCLLNYIIILRNVIINTTHLLKNPQSKFIEVIPAIPGREGMNLELTENRDYTLNYKEATITLEDAWGIGTLKVEYYPLWIQGLKIEEFPFRTDFLTETFTHTPTLTLKTIPLDPLRSVEKYNPEKNKWIELAEDVDYNVEYPQKTVHILKDYQNTKYRVRYTPYLTDEGLALAYHMKRKDTNQQATIKSCYFQNRV